MIKLNKYDEIIYVDQAYYTWLNELKAGDEVTWNGSRSYWDSGLSICKVLDNQKDVIVLDNGRRINTKTGRENYTRSSYHDNKVHILPVTDEHRFNIEQAEVREQFNKATNRSDNRYTISEMREIIKFANKILMKRKSHYPVMSSEDDD